MSDQENEGMEQDIEEPVDDLGTDEPTVVTSGEVPDDADSDDEAGKAVPKDKRITVSTPHTVTVRNDPFRHHL